MRNKKFLEPIKVIKKEKFFDFRDVQTKPTKWARRTPPYLYEWTPMEIYLADNKKK